MEKCIETIEEHMANGYSIDIVCLFDASPDNRFLAIRFRNGGNIVSVSFTGKQIPVVEKYLRDIKIKIKHATFH